MDDKINPVAAQQAAAADKIVCPGCHGIGTWIGQHDGYDDADCHMCDDAGKIAAPSDGAAKAPAAQADARVVAALQAIVDDMRVYTKPVNEEGETVADVFACVLKQADDALAASPASTPEVARQLAYELMGVIVDVESGRGFDSVCLDTIKRVRDSILAPASTPEASQQAAAVECGLCNDTGIVGFPPDRYEDCPDCTKAAAKAPAAQAVDAPSVVSAIASMDRGEDEHDEDPPGIFTKDEVLDMLERDLLTDSGVATLRNGDSLKFPLDELAILANHAAERAVKAAASPASTPEASQQDPMDEVISMTRRQYLADRNECFRLGEQEGREASQQAAAVAAPSEGLNLYRKTALVQAEQFRPAEGKIPKGVYSDGYGDPRKNPLCSWVLDTKEGKHYLRGGDYVCTGPAGEQWNVEQSIFESTYELAAPTAVAATTSEDARDAALYRWLRDQAIYQQEVSDGWYEIKVEAPLQDDVEVTAEQFDMQVRAAMRTTQQEGSK